MNYERWISYRYLNASKGRFLTFLNIVSVGGVAIGVASLIVVLSVMEGFGNNLREKIIGTTPHIMIEKETGIKDYETLREEVKGIEGVKGAAPYVQGSIFLEEGGQAMGIAVRGIEPNLEDQVTKVNEYLLKGQLSQLNGKTVIIGNELARFYGYKVGDQITLISPGAGISGQGWRYKLEIVGIFSTGMVDFDMNLVIVGLNTAKELFNLPENYASGLGVRLNDPYQAEIVKKRIYKKIGFGYLVKNWMDINRNLFEALFLEKWGLFIILILMVLVASFNIISTLVVTVSSKIHDIGILQSIGVPRASIRRIFRNQGIYIGLIGTSIGACAGLLICYLLKTYFPVPKAIYSIDHVPVDIQPLDMGVIVLAALLISYLATLYPAAKAASLQPVEALRYE